MAGPVKWFRKHRKPAFAILTIFTMFAFVFIPILLDRIPQRGVQANAVVVSTARYGKLRESDIRSLARERYIVHRLLQDIAQALMQKRVQGEAVQGALAYMGSDPTSEKAVVETWLMAQRAKDLGLLVNDEAVNAFLNEVTEGKVPGGQIEKTIRFLQTSDDIVFRALGREILAMRLREMFGLGLPGMPPAQRYDYYLRLNRQAKIEAIPVAVDKFVDLVPDPSGDELRAFFEKYKDRVYSPDSPEPGFREPHRVDVQYFKAQRESFVNPKEVSEEAIRKYYEQNKERYREQALPELPKLPPSKPEAAKPPAVKPEGAKPQAVRPEGAKREPAKSEGAKPEGAKPGAKEKGGSSGVPSQSTFRLVSYKEEADWLAGKAGPPAAKAEQPAAKAEQPAAKPVPAPKAEPSQPKLEPPAAKTEKPALKTEAPVAKPAPAKAEPGAAKAEPGAAKAEPGAGKAEPGAAKPAEAKKEEPKYIPLEKVQNAIRDRLADEQAEQKMRSVLTALQGKMSVYQRQWVDYKAKVKTQAESALPPPELDFAAMAKEKGVQAFRTGLVAAYQMEGMDIGKSVAGNNSFVSLVYGALPEYRPTVSQDAAGDSYLSWKVADDPEHSVSWEESGVRERVLKKWKEIEARDLAAKQAERLAAEARQSSKPLKDLAAAQKGLTVLAPEPFSWMTFGAFPSAWVYGQPPRLSDVKGVVDGGIEFMRGVFRLRPGETGLAWNQPKTVVYVVRLVQYTPPENELWTRFLNTPAEAYMGVARYDWATMFQTWKDDLDKQAGLKWHREAAPERGGEQE